MEQGSTRAGIWRCGSYELALDRPIVMGILNVTPDSFSDGGTHDDPADAVAAGMRMWVQGATIVDVGGESTRPGSAELAHGAEISRVRPVVSRLAMEDRPISVDTRHADVAAACVEAGASIINDVSGFRDEAMVEVAVACEAGLVVMHMLGEPATMQASPYYDDVVSEVGGYLLAQAATLEAAGVARERIALDPGLGFGKTLAHNLALIRGLPLLARYGYPILIGASRKRFIGEITGEAEPQDRMAGSVAVAVESVHRGASIVRVHDVQATVQALAITVALRDSTTEA